MSEDNKKKALSDIKRIIKANKAPGRDGGLSEKGLSEKETLGLKELFKMHQEACGKYPATIFDFLAIGIV